MKEIEKGSMPRKNKKDTPIWWSKKLIQLGLSMEKGRSRKLIYVGTSTDLEYIAGKQTTVDSGKQKDAE